MADDAVSVALRMANGHNASLEKATKEQGGVRTEAGYTMLAHAILLGAVAIVQAIREHRDAIILSANTSARKDTTP